MTISLRPITADNWVDCIQLSVTEEQQRIGFVAPNVLSLAQAYAEPWWRPLAIYADEAGVGMVMYGRWPERGIPPHHGRHPAGIYCILRLMIDAAQQGQGYGRTAMEALLRRISHESDGEAIEICYDPDNQVAAHLYTSLGFEPTGEVEEGEIVARLSISDYLSSGR